jgi:hypothetical protein
MTKEYKKLPEWWSQYLVKQPETGMDYHVVNLTFKDGTIIQDVAIIHSSIIGEIRERDDVSIVPDDIIAIEVTHRKWQFKQ